MLYQDFLTHVLTETSEVANQQFGKVSGVVKATDNNQVLTQTDLAIGELLIHKIKQEYPEYNILDEETGIIDNKSAYTWVIDPIDGTSNFASGVPLYGTYLGLLYNDKPIAGGISIPPLREIYIAEHTKGAFCNGKPIHVIKENLLKNVLVAYSLDAHPEEKDFVSLEGKLFAEIALQVRNIRSSTSAFDGAMVAKGAYGAWLCRSSKVWDNVALQIVIEEAGGIYTDFFGKKINYSRILERTMENFTYCAASPILHKALQEIIHKSF